MNKEIVLTDLFAGIGGFALGLAQAGFTITKHNFSEIDKHAIAVYQKHYPHAKNLGPIQQAKPTTHSNIVTFGSPCQDFSQLGSREGTVGEKSQLIAEAIRFIDQNKPDVFIWENVKGAYSTNQGRDFQAILQAFTNIGGYRLEWQLLDTSWFLPQTRSRIYLVGHLAGKSEPKVFPFTEDDPVFTTLRTEAQGQFQGQDCATALTRQPTSAPCTLVWVPDRLVPEKLKLGPFYPLPPAPFKSQPPRSILDCVGADVRRMTEIECERIQGFPDNWTRFGNHNGKQMEISGTQRYRMCGNAVSVPVVKAIGQRLLAS